MIKNIIEIIKIVNYNDNSNINYHLYFTKFKKNKKR